MFRNKKVNMIISVLVGVALWMFVMGDVNPTTEEKVTDVPLIFQGEETLDQKGLAIAPLDDVTLTVTIKGNRSKVRQVKAADIQAVVNVSDLVNGENSVVPVITVPDGVALVKSTPEAAILKVEKRVVASRSVEATFVGKVAGSGEAGNVSINPDSLEISGAKGYVDKVDHVSAPVSVNEIKQKDTTIKTQGVAVDSKGNPVPHVRVHSDEISVTASILSIKTVPLEATTTGIVGDAYEVESVEIPKEVVIKGPKEVLDGVDKIKAQVTDISAVTKNSSLPLILDLPSDVETGAESKGVSIRVTLKEPSTTTVEYGPGTIEVRNLKKGTTATVNSGKIVATIKARESLFKGLTKEDITIYVDAAGGEPGKYTLRLNGAYTKSFRSVLFNPEEVEVIISEE